VSRAKWPYHLGARQNRVLKCASFNPLINDTAGQHLFSHCIHIRIEREIVSPCFKVKNGTFSNAEALESQALVIEYIDIIIIARRYRKANILVVEFASRGYRKCSPHAQRNFIPQRDIELFIGSQRVFFHLINGEVSAGLVKKPFKTRKI